MPKINVYLPDELAAAVREVGLSVSPICQRALADAVARAAATRDATSALRDPRFDPTRHPDVVARLDAEITTHLRRALTRARAMAGVRGAVGVAHLLIGVLDEPDNLGAHLLASPGVDVARLRADVVRAAHIPASRRAPTTPPSAADGTVQPVVAAMTIEARAVLARALEAAGELGHHFLGCEHLVLALADDGSDPSSRLLTDAGVDAASLRRALPTALGAAALGYANATKGRPDPLAERVRDLEERMARLERGRRPGRARDVTATAASDPRPDRR